MVYLYEACDQISDFCHQQLLRKMRRKISWKDGGTEVKQYTPLPFWGGGGIIMAKRKRTINDLQNTTQKTKDRATQTPLKIGGELRCSGRVGSS